MKLITINSPYTLTKACLLSLLYHFLISVRTSNRLWLYKGGECTEILRWIHTAILYCKNMTLKHFSHSFSPDEGPWTNRASVTAICTSAWSTDGPIVLCNKRRSVALYSQIGADMTRAASPGYTAALCDDYVSICPLENGCSVQASQFSL